MDKKVLVIDDDKELLWLFETILNQEQIQTITYQSGIPLAEIIAAAPDLVLLDVNIIGYAKSGVDICTEIKANKHLFNTPVLLVSAESDLNALARRCGADDFIAKPFNIDYLMDKVKKLLT
ncbi:two-component system response regulator [Pedobacter sp. KLB.chiD]|uniref:response regulator n=1 Tax=Pedobacter sp. KLB.chiD TaxID=3387402 RepID=UPI00399A6CD3